MADINVLMVGGRRAGKTSLLAATKKCCDDLFLQKIDVSPSVGGNRLNDKIAEMQNYFTGMEYQGKQIFHPDNSPTDNPSEYVFEVDVNNFNATYTIGFTDVPGGYYGDNALGEHRADEWEKAQLYVDEEIRNSQVFLIAIDTPHLMEKPDANSGYGAGHEWFNRVFEITNFFKAAFQKSAEHRLILFVPVKCEKYRDQGRMPEVVECIKKGYADLITFLRTEPVASLCTVAIAPVITLGGASFLRFENNDPEKEYYCKDVGQYAFMGGAKRCYQPEHCEQPLMLMLRYLLDVAQEQKQGQYAIVRWFQQKFLHSPKLADLEACADEIDKAIIRDANQGFVQLHPQK